MARNDNTGPTDRSTLCDLCGGGTYTFPSGSVWCPSESCKPGGHFVVRVAFERPPARVIDRTEWASQPPKRQPTAERTPRRSAPTSQPVKVEPKDDGFNTGYDAFVKGDRS
jgi:hypothetical protein